jgi:hypothetical protein
MENLEDFVHRENLKIFRRQLELAKDDVRRQLLLKSGRGRGESPGAT